MNHAELQAALARADLAADASEAHGLLCGALCARTSYGARDWLADLATDQGVAVPEPEPELERLPARVLDALSSAEFEFEPLLPADDAELSERVAALAAWCSGYLYGVAAGAARPEALREGEVGEYLGDLADISRAQLEPGRNAEAGEGDFFELVEFVRAGAQLVFDALAETRSHAA